MKISRPLSSPPQPEQPVHRASGQSISAGGHGSSGNAQGYKDPPDQFHGGPNHDLPGVSIKDRLHRGPEGEDFARRPCASGTSVRGPGGGHSGSVACSFVLPGGGAAGASEKKASPFQKLAEKLGDLLKRLLGSAPVEHSPGRVATGESSRSAGSTHSGSSQGRTGVDEEPQAGDSARVGG
ncbi:hypothetical protein [Corallococcus carmarthensis]|uniref:hypothetical protein n=1 Tax=Corallococcus carmarthensis TaxID=2316728 RepID=UPI00148E0B86|nr:hypothetical protein [Corallococcus carmarthensis]NOK23301.1 hypothetical protein [Corallococcus carmarthensis]